jgi:hypothetical protein
MYLREARFDEASQAGTHTQREGINTEGRGRVESDSPHEDQDLHHGALQLAPKPNKKRLHQDDSRQHQPTEVGYR